MKEDLEIGTLGNGYTIWDRKREKNGDYLTVAHINYNRTINYRVNDLSEEAKAIIEKLARTGNGYSSHTQPYSKALKELGYTQEKQEEIRVEFREITNTDKLEVTFIKECDSVWAKGTKEQCEALKEHFDEKGFQNEMSRNGDKYTFVLYGFY